MRFDLVPLTAAALKLPRASHARITATLIARRDGTQRDVLAAE
jgi:hypothetical protein